MTAPWHAYAWVLGFSAFVYLLATVLFVLIH